MKRLSDPSKKRLALIYEYLSLQTDPNIYFLKCLAIALSTFFESCLMGSQLLAMFGSFLLTNFISKTRVTLLPSRVSLWNLCMSPQEGGIVADTATYWIFT